MWENKQISRKLTKLLPDDSGRQLLLLTGARQTGKTTLVRKHYKDIPYYNLDAMEYRDQLSSISTFRWAKEVGVSVIDEIQKAPELFDKIKYSYDDGSLNFSVLTGSSQILLLRKVQETLAGRAFLLELFPFILSELIDPEALKSGNSLLEELIGSTNIDEIFEAVDSVLFGESLDIAVRSEEWLNIWGGMAPLIHLPGLDEKRFWLKDYAVAYLERDLADLASLNDLKPFRKFQQMAALRTANLISYTELAKDSGIGIETARRYLEYLRISYQAFLLQPYHKNLTSSLVKTPKLFWFDNGLLRHLSGFGFDIDSGQLYENYVAAEMMKMIRTSRLDTRLYFYRTRSGMEIDFILEKKEGFVAIEVKNRDTVSLSDFAKIKRLADANSARWCGGIVVYRGNKIQKFGHNLWAVPSIRLFS
jgi:uncharacterized protein